MSQPKKILISALTHWDSSHFLPYVHAILKAHCLKNPALRESYDWLEPIFLDTNTDELLNSTSIQDIDVLGLSCYAWNWRQQIEIAKIIKTANPNCLIVAGGPQPDWNDKEFYKKFPIIDIVVKQEGEIAFERILLENLELKPNFKQITGLVLRNYDQSTLDTGPAELLKDWGDNSPYYDLPDLQLIVKKYSGQHQLSAVWETNRGCPYKCSFCDWGSATYSKVRQFSTERVEKDLKFFSENKIQFIFLADANFGIFERDVGFAQSFGNHRLKFGFPDRLYWPTAKNNPERVLKIAKIFKDSRVPTAVYVPLQSTDATVLQVMGRSSSTLKKQFELIEGLRAENIPMIGQVILGAPGETINTLKNTMHELLELGFHDSFCVFFFEILPNAPVTNPEYIKQYQIESIVRPTYKIRGKKSNLANLDQWGKSEYLVKHSSMSKQDWIMMNEYSFFIQGCHHLRLTYYVSRYLKETKNINYAVFYEKLYSSVLKNEVFSSVLNTIRKNLFDYVESDTTVVGIDYANLTVLVEPETYMFVRFVENRSAFSSVVKNAISEVCQFDEEILDLLNYQESIIIGPEDRGYRAGTLPLKFDWARYFADISREGRDVRPIQFESIKNFKWEDSLPTACSDFQTYVTEVIPMRSLRHLRSPTLKNLKEVETKIIGLPHDTN